MINAKVKEAWRIANDLPPQAIVKVLANAYIEAEWQRRKVEFQLSWHTTPISNRTDQMILFRSRTDADWRAEVQEELKG